MNRFKLFAAGLISLAFPLLLQGQSLPTPEFRNKVVHLNADNTLSEPDNTDMKIATRQAATHLV